MPLPTSVHRQPFQGRLARTLSVILLLLALLPVLLMGGIAYFWARNLASTQAQLNALLGTTLALLLGMLTLAALSFWFCYRRFLRPVLELSATVDSFTAGDWSQRAPLQGDDEIGLLAASLNYMADELSGLYRDLENEVEQRAFRLRLTAELSQVAVSAASLDDLLRRSANLLFEQLPLNFAGFYLVDETGKYLELRQAAGPAQIAKRARGLRLPVDNHSLVGWVAGFNQARLSKISEGMNTPGERQDLVSGTRAEAALPMAVGEQVLGVLNVQAADPSLLIEENLADLKALANWIAPAIQNFHLLDSTQYNLAETNLLYQASHQIAQAETSEQVLAAAADALQQTCYASAILLPGANGLRVTFAAIAGSPAAGVAGWLSVPATWLEANLSRPGPVILSAASADPELPAALRSLPAQLQSDLVSLLPVMRSNRLAALFVLGARQRERGAHGAFSPRTLQPFAHFAELVTTSLEKLQALQDTQKRLAELQTINSIGEAISVETDLHALYQVIHKQVNQVMGEVNFLIALYEPHTQQIHIPYMIEDGLPVNIPPFPVGEGLTSLLIRTGQPLMLVEDTVHQAEKLGAKVIGEPAKSWLGVPLLVGGEVIGAMIVQDTVREHRFDEEHRRLLVTLASQVAVVVRNARLLENTRHKAEHERLLYEITARIHRSAGIPGILKTTAEQLGVVLGVRRAQIEIRPPLNGDELRGKNGKDHRG